MTTLNEAALLAAQKITASMVSGIADSLGRIVEDAPPEILLEIQKQVKRTILAHINPLFDERDKQIAEKEMECSGHANTAAERGQTIKRWEENCERYQAKLAEVTAERDRLLDELTELTHQWKNEGNGEYSIPAWFGMEILKQLEQSRKGEG